MNVLEDDSRRWGLQEAYQQLRTNVEFAALDGEIRSLIITSAQPGEGKTTTAVNLAIMTARAGKGVILVDTDLRRPSVHLWLGGRNQVGVTTALLSTSSELPQSLLQDTPLPNLQVITSGPLPPNPAEVLGSKKMAPFMQQLRDRSDIVIYDTPPSVAVADAAILAAHVDAVLLVVDTGHTRVNALRTGMDHIVRSRTRIIGAVLNKVSSHSKGYHSYYYYYSTHYGVEQRAIGRNGSHAEEHPVEAE
jgi:capsular exopolysaccharide synthesis family protein